MQSPLLILLRSFSVFCRAFAHWESECPVSKSENLQHFNASCLSLCGCSAAVPRLLGGFWLLPISTLLLLLASNRMQPHGPMSPVSPKVSLSESCIIVGEQRRDLEMSLSASFLLSFLARVVMLLLYLALVSYSSGKL